MTALVLQWCHWSHCPVTDWAEVKACFCELGGAKHSQGGRVASFFSLCQRRHTTVMKPRRRRDHQVFPFASSKRLDLILQPHLCYSDARANASCLSPFFGQQHLATVPRLWARVAPSPQCPHSSARARSGFISSYLKVTKAIANAGGW